MKVLFHITPQKNLQSILEKGLLPNRDGRVLGLTTRFYSKSIDSFRRNVIWLTPDSQYIIEYQAGSDWTKKENPAILTVDVESLLLDSFSEKEYLHYGEIPKERIIGVENVLHNANYSFCSDPLRYQI